MDSGVARRPIADMARYARDLAQKLDAASGALEAITERVRANPRRVVFAEGEEEKVIRAAIAFRNAGYGTPVLVGREDRITATVAAMGVPLPDGIEIHNASRSLRTRDYAEYLYGRKQREGFLFRDAQRAVNLDRNIFAACMVALGDADALVTGTTRSYAAAVKQITLAIDPAPSSSGGPGVLFGMTLLLTRRAGTVLVADTTIHERPDAETLAEIAVQAATQARRLGLEPRVAFLSYSNFGDPRTSVIPGSVRHAVRLLDERGDVGFEYEGEMSADVALDPSLHALYPFCRLTGAANVLIMPGLHAAHIFSKAVPRLTSATAIGPLLVGLGKPAQILSIAAGVNTILDTACLAANDAIPR